MRKLAERFFWARRKRASFINSSQGLGERGKVRSKRSGPNDEPIAEGAMGEEEDRSGKAAASRTSDEFMKEARESAFEFKKALSENNSCYVLITCSEASKDGKMKVEMSYGGDPVLAAYLVESAQNIIDTDIS